MPRCRTTGKFAGFMSHSNCLRSRTACSRLTVNCGGTLYLGAFRQKLNESTRKRTRLLAKCHSRAQVREGTRHQGVDEWTNTQEGRFRGSSRVVLLSLRWIAPPQTRLAPRCWRIWSGSRLLSLHSNQRPAPSFSTARRRPAFPPARTCVNSIRRRKKPTPLPRPKACADSWSEFTLY